MTVEIATMRYVITYDLHAPETSNDYKRLIDELKRLGAQKLQYSQWIVRRYDTTCAGLRDYIWQFMDANDRLMVQSLDSSDWAGMRLLVDPNTV